MAYEIKKPELPHNIILENRERLNLSGVEDVESFSEDTVVVYTTAGTLVVKGSALHIERLSLDQSELVLSGQVDSLNYESDEHRVSLFQRLFK